MYTKQNKTFPGMAFDKSQNYTTGSVVFDGSDYFQANSNVANHVSASGSAVFPDASSATTSTRFLHQNGASSKVWKPTVNLTGIAHIQATQPASTIIMMLLRVHQLLQSVCKLE